MAAASHMNSRATTEGTGHRRPGDCGFGRVVEVQRDRHAGSCCQIAGPNVDIWTTCWAGRTGVSGLVEQACIVTETVQHKGDRASDRAAVIGERDRLNKMPGGPIEPEPAPADSYLSGHILSDIRQKCHCVQLGMVVLHIEDVVPGAALEGVRVSANAGEGCVYQSCWSARRTVHHCRKQGS